MASHLNITGPCAKSYLKANHDINPNEHWRYIGENKTIPFNVDDFELEWIEYLRRFFPLIHAHQTAGKEFAQIQLSPLLVDAWNIKYRGKNHSKRVKALQSFIMPVIGNGGAIIGLTTSIAN